MKIVLINRMLGIKVGGGENFDINFVNELRLLGHQVIPIAGKYLFKNKEESPRVKNLGAIYVRSPYLRGISYYLEAKGNVSQKIAMLFSYLDLTIFQLVCFMKITTGNKLKADVYHCSGLPILSFLMRLRGYQTVIRWPGPFPSFFNNIANKANVNIADGDAYIKLKERGIKNLSYLGKAIDVLKYIPIEKQHHTEIEFLFVGRIVPIKNLDMLVKAVGEISSAPFKLTIVGDHESSEGSRIIKLVNDLKLEKKIEFIGEKSGEELISCYQKADVFVISSFYDNSPTVVLEAMACGLPVVGTNVGGIPLQVTEGVNGSLVEGRNYRALAAVLLKYINSPGLIRKQGLNARETIIKNNSLEKVYLKYIELVNGNDQDTTKVNR